MEALILSLLLAVIADWLMGMVVTLFWERDLGFASLWPIGYLLWLTSDRLRRVQKILLAVLAGLVFLATYKIADPIANGLLQMAGVINLEALLMAVIVIYLSGFLVFMWRGQGWRVSALWPVFLIINHSGPRENVDRPAYLGSNKEWLAASRQLRR